MWNKLGTSKSLPYNPGVFKCDCSLETYLELWIKRAVPKDLHFSKHFKIILIRIWILFLISVLLIYLIYFTVLYWFCHILTWILHGCTCVPHPDPRSHLLSHPTPLGHPSAPALSTLYPIPNLDWRFISHVMIYMFQCHSPKPSCLYSLPQGSKDCSIHLCLFCCLAYRVIITIFLNSIYMH